MTITKDKLTGNKGEWSESYIAMKLVGDGKLSLADEDGKAMPDQWLNVLEVIRYEAASRVVNYHRPKDTETDIRIEVDGELVVCVPVYDFLHYADELKEQIINAKGTRTFSVSDDINDFLERIEITCLKAKSKDKSDIYISAEDPRTSIERHHIGFSIKSNFGKPPTLFNTGKNSAAIYKLSNMNDCLMNEINAMNDEKGNTAVKKRCQTLQENHCEFEFVGFPVAAREGCKTFEESLDLINPRLNKVFDCILRLHFLEGFPDRNVDKMMEVIIEKNPCKITRPEIKYPYMMKTFLYSAYCGLTAGATWDGSSQVNGGFIAVDEKGNITANLALESDEFKSYLYKHCFFEWPSTSRNHGDYAYVYKEGDDYFFKLNFQIRYK